MDMDMDMDEEEVKHSEPKRANEPNQSNFDPLQ